MSRPGTSSGKCRPSSRSATSGSPSTRRWPRSTPPCRRSWRTSRTRSTPFKPGVVRLQAYLVVSSCYSTGLGFSALAYANAGGAEVYQPVSTVQVKCHKTLQTHNPIQSQRCQVVFVEMVACIDSTLPRYRFLLFALCFRASTSLSNLFSYRNFFFFFF